MLHKYKCGSSEMKEVGSEKNGPGVINVVEFLLILKC